MLKTKKNSTEIEYLLDTGCSSNDKKDRSTISAKIFAYNPIGMKVKKLSGKPFKSRNKVNTVKGIINHPELKRPCFIFEEDESCVEILRCLIFAL